ncbi:LANO_0D07778g1_1 [Lachancea nothofagi CBS 11611]|uniref:LANO_0D07778g1_1 n=1 Tax=Lachancea nothofagi CBS 11611 TaxID=1266666 RepID=A0A1G4JIB4_9SACH|nr:LANO_0D07778g1_1 [Lachancea nothofagi CBS 11611]
MSDPRTRKARHLLTPELLSSSILITDLPANWNESTISSVVAGSGPITNISRKVDPRNGKLVGIIVDYTTSKDSKRALEVLRKIKKFPCGTERIISNTQKNSKEKSTPLELDRNAFPWDCGLELPFEMVSEVPLPRRPTNPVPVTSNGSSSDSNSPTAFPDILSKASKHLPGFVANSMTAPDAISSNLSKIAPLQLLEMISNLKILANQDPNREQLTNFLASNPDISIAVSQAMLEMGFINYNVVTKVIAEQPGARSQSPNQQNSTAQVFSNNNTPGTTPMNSNAAMNTYTAPVRQPQPQLQPQVQPPLQTLPQPPLQSLQQTQLQPPQVTPMAFSPPQQHGFGYNTAPNVVPFAASPMPVKAAGDRVNMMKLAALPQQQQDMIKQVLQLTADQIRLLPPDQVAMVENFKREYLM